MAEQCAQAPHERQPEPDPWRRSRYGFPSWWNSCPQLVELLEELVDAIRRDAAAVVPDLEPEPVAALGGAEQIDQNALEVISYVYSFEGKKGTAVGQIAALAAKKCRAGGFSIAAPPAEPAAPAVAPTAETPAAAASSTPTPPR